MNKVLNGVGSVLSSISPLGTILGMGKSTTTPTPAATPGPIVMPLADDAKLKLEARRKAAARLTGGRSSTILTDNSDKLGG